MAKYKNRSITSLGEGKRKIELLKIHNPSTKIYQQTATGPLKHYAST